MSAGTPRKRTVATTAWSGSPLHGQGLHCMVRVSTKTVGGLVPAIPCKRILDTSGRNFKKTDQKARKPKRESFTAATNIVTRARARTHRMVQVQTQQKPQSSRISFCPPPPPGQPTPGTMETKTLLRHTQIEHVEQFKGRMFRCQCHRVLIPFVC